MKKYQIAGRFLLDRDHRRPARVFDIIMYTEFGTYNSYVMKAGDKTVLFETAKAKFLTTIWRSFRK